MARVLRPLRRLAFCSLGFALSACTDLNFTGDGDTVTPTDSGEVDLGPADTGITDSEAVDQGLADTGADDTGAEDTGSLDVGPLPIFAIQIAYSTGAVGMDEVLFLTDTSNSRRILSSAFASGPTPGGNQSDGLRGFAWRPDGRGIIYEAFDNDRRLSLFYAPMHGAVAGDSRLVSSPGGTSEPSFPLFANGFSNQNAHIFFTQSEVVGESGRLRTANLALTNPASVVVSGEASAAEFLAPAGSRVIFKTGFGRSPVQELWLADVAAPAPNFGRTRLNSGAPVDRARSAVWSPAIDQLAYVTEDPVSGSLQLNTSTVQGTQVSNRVRVRTLQPASGIAVVARARTAFSADGVHLAFGDNPLSPDTNDLYLVDLSLPVSQPFLTLSGPVAAGALGVLRFQWSPSADTLVYISQHEVAGPPELYLADRRNPGVSYKINSPLLAGESVTGERWLDDGTVFFEAGLLKSKSTRRRLFIADVRDPTSIVLTEIHPAVTDDETIRAYQFTPGNGEMVFRVDDSVNLSAAFWRVEIQNGTLAGPATMLTPTSYQAQFCGAPDGRWALIAPLDVPDQAELYLYVPEGSPKFQKVSGPVVAGGRVRACAFPPNGRS